MAELEAQLGYDELIEWQAYDRLDPFGGYRQDLQTAHLLYIQSTAKNAKISDFLPVDPFPMTDEMREQYEILQAQKEAQSEVEAMIAGLTAYESKTR